MPKRIQRRRSKGWRMPAGAVYVGRPTIWGNPFDDAISFQRWLSRGEIAVSSLRDRHWFPWTPESNKRLAAVRNRILERLVDLRGKNLVCWCGLDCDCHADVLLELANR